MKYEIFQPLSIHNIGQRDNQEDSIYPVVGHVTKDDRLFILCDGMGGHLNGEVASSMVCATLSDFVNTKIDKTKPFTDLMMAQAMAAVYNKLNALDKDETSGNRKMGTTLVMLFFHAGGLMAAHIGDSRYYHVRPKNHEIVYQSKDHSLINDLYDAGEISPEDMKSMKIRNVIQRVVMPNQEHPAMPDIVHIKDIRPDDWFYICSDGMLENMDDEELLNILCNESMTDEQKRDCLIAATDNNKDNHSAHLIHVASVIHEIIDENEPDDEIQGRQNNKNYRPLETQTPEVIVETYPQTAIQPSVTSTDTCNAHQNTKSFSTNSVQKNSSRFILLSLIVAVLAFGVVCAFFEDHKEEKTMDPVEIRYEEVPSGKTISRDRKMESDIHNQAAQKKGQRTKSKERSGSVDEENHNKIGIGGSAAVVGKNPKDVIQPEIKQGAKAIVTGSPKAQETAESSVNIDALINTSPKENDKKNEENKPREEKLKQGGTTNDRN